MYPIRPFLKIYTYMFRINLMFQKCFFFSNLNPNFPKMAICRKQIEYILQYPYESIVGTSSLVDTFDVALPSGPTKMLFGTIHCKRFVPTRRNPSGDTGSPQKSQGMILARNLVKGQPVPVPLLWSNTVRLILHGKRDW